jgi:hypothetical protein
MQDPGNRPIGELAQELARRQMAAQLRQLEQAQAEGASSLPPLPPEVRSAGGAAVYEAYVRMRDVMRSQLEQLQDQREEVSEQLQEPMVGGADRAGLSRRIENLDSRIAVLDRQLADIDRAITQAAASPGSRVVIREVRPGPPPANSPADEELVIVLGSLFILAVLLPLAIAYARRIWRRGAQVAADLPRDIIERLTKMDQNIDAIAIEVERIGESQRYLTRVFSDQQAALPAGAAKPVEAPERDAEWQRRSP